MKNLGKILVTVLLTLLAVSIQNCDNSEPGLAQTQMEMKAVTTLSSIKNARSKIEGLEFETVMVGVTKIEFETIDEHDREESGDFEDEDEDGEDDSGNIEYEGSFVVDLINGTSTPDFGLADLAPGIYNDIKIKMGPILDGGNTIFIAFNYIPEGATDPVRVEYSNNYEIEIEIDNEQGYQLDEGAINQILVLLDLDTLFGTVDLSNATVDSDGILRINQESNAAIESQIIQNFKNSIRAGEDDDDNGEIDHEEDESEGDDD